MSDQWPYLSTLTYFAFMLNIEIARRGNVGFTVADLDEAIADGSLWGKLGALPDCNFDNGLFVDEDSREGPATLQTLRRLAVHMRGRGAKDYAIRDENGLSMLLAYVIEAISQEHWKPAAKSRFVDKQ